MSMQNKVGSVGPSLGWLFAKIGTIANFEAITAAGVDCVEFVIFGGVKGEQRRRAIAQLPRSPLPASLHLFSLDHLSGVENVADLSTETREELADYQTICRHHPIHTVSVHPDCTPLSAYKLLSSCNKPLAVENMDALKATGRTPKELQTIINNISGLGYVLDLQHVFEVARATNCNPQELTLGFADFMGDRIRYLHVSGELVIHGKQAINHAQLHIATNRRTIIQMLASVLKRARVKLPIILEGEYLLHIPEGYKLRDDAEQLELLALAVEDMRQERDYLLNEI